jgi:glycosyltransferase involved in cell wall biosynthesis
VDNARRVEAKEGLVTLRRRSVGGQGGHSMSAMRQDPSHRSGLAGWSRVRAAGEGPEREAGGVLSVVVPAKNEAASLPQLVDEIAEALRPLCDARGGVGHRLDGFEIVIVDDGSTDETPSVLRQLAMAYPELRPLSLLRNVGQSAATAAGFRAARGDWVATLDADLQNHPFDLAALWAALPGHDAALGWRSKREDVWSKRVISRCANRVRNQVLGQSIRDTGCSVRIFPREMALRLPMFHGCHRFFGPLLLREGCRIVQLPVTHRPRPHGRSHYNLWNRSLRVIVDLFGVAWLMRRPTRYEVAPEAASAPLPCPGLGPSHASSTAPARRGIGLEV